MSQIKKRATTPMIHGCRSYHRCLPGNQAGGIEYYIYDKEHERARAKLPHAIPSSHIDDLRQFFLRENSHVRAIRCMADVEAATATLVLRHNVSPRSAPPGISHASAS